MENGHVTQLGIDNKRFARVPETIKSLKWLKEFIVKRKLSLMGIVTMIVILAPWAIFSMYKFGQIFPDTFSHKIWQGTSGYWRHVLIELRGLKGHFFYSGALTMVLLGFGVIGFVFMIKAKSLFLYIICFTIIQQVAYTIFNVPMYHWYYAIPDFAICLSGLYAVGTLLNITKTYLAAKHTNLIKISPAIFNAVPSACCAA